MTVAEDSLLVREGIATMLAGEPDIEIEALCADYDELMASIDDAEPDVVITDIRMPPTGTDEGHSGGQPSCDAPIRRWASWCCPSTSTRPTPSPCSTPGPRAAPIC